MKRGFSILVAIMMLLTLAGAAFAEDSTASTVDATASATQAPNSNNEQGGPMNDGSHMMGTITAIGDTTITITTNGGMQPPQNGNGQGNAPQGNDQQNGAPQGGNAQGNPPQGGNTSSDSTQSTAGAPADANANGQASAEQTTVVLTINADTTYSQRASDGTTTTLALSDLSVDQMISVTVSGDETSGYTAVSISVETAPTQPAATDSATTTQSN